MDEHSEFPSALDLAGRAGAIVVGLTTLTIQFFPFALPLLILVIGPLAVLGLAAALLALPILLPLWLVRRILRARQAARVFHPAHPEGARRHQPSSRPPASAERDRLGREASSSARASTRAA